MWKFLLGLFKKALVLVVGYVLLLVLGVALTIYSLRSLEREPRPIAPESVLVIDLAINIPDTPRVAPLSDQVFDALNERRTSSVHLLELVDAIHTAREDERISGIFLHGNFLPMDYGTGFAALSEFRQALDAFRQAGKPVFAYLRSPGLREIYLCSVADKLALHPYSEMDLSGLAVTTPFFASALNRAGVGIQTLRAGRFKSALEPFTETGLSEDSRAQIVELTTGLWDQMLGTIVASRGLDPETVMRGGLGGSAIYTPETALSEGLVDEVYHFDEMVNHLIMSVAEAPSLDADPSSEASALLQVGLPRYLRAMESEQRGFRHQPLPSGDAPTIAVVYAEGDIVDGSGGIGNIGGDHLARNLRSLRGRDDLAAVVLRVNTPGGSAQASEVIHREVQLLAKRVPVVVSFGSIAASGGYWIATPANQIFVDPLTITGSIGVFGLVFHVDEAAAKLGVQFETVTTHPFADISSVTRPKTEKEMQILQHFVDRIYADFLARVASGRSLDPGEVEALAEGRVYTGAAALEFGLADRVGGLSSAIEAAAELSDLAPGTYHLQEIPGKLDPVQSLLATLFTGDDDGELLSAKPQVRLMNDPWLRRIQNLVEAVRSGQQIQARLPIDLWF